MAETSWTAGDVSESETLTGSDHLYAAHINELRTAVNVIEAILDPDTNLLTSPVITSLQINDTSANHQYVFAVNELTADRTVTLPLLTGNDEFVFKDHTQTLTNKTLTSPVISSISNTGTLTLPTSTDTLVGRATTDTLTNKTLTSPVLTTPKVDAISEETAAAGVTVDTLLIKDGVARHGDNAIQTLIKARAYPNATQVITTATDTHVLLQSEDYDIGGDFASSTFTALVTGYYLVTGRVTYNTPTDGKRYWVKLWKNTASVAYASIVAAATGTATICPAVADVLHLAATDTVKLYTYHDKGSDDTINNGAGGKQQQTCLTVHLLSVD